jgi:deazaflavin-dependent oxidoreductase (nitroreductase family)
VDMRERNRQVVEQFRAGGPIEGMHRDRIVLLTTTGRRTGREYTTPMMFVRDGDRVLVLASNAGAPKAPDWFHNLVATPDVTVELADESYPATATALSGSEYAEKWAWITELFPFFADHAEKAGRRIPVVALVRK